MKNLKIGTKIFLGFFCVFILLLAIASAAVISSFNTGSNIDEVSVYGGLQSNANELIHILNETRITAAVLYDTHSAESYGNVTKQLMYCDLRLKKLYEYIALYPELSSFYNDIQEFDMLYSEWCGMISGINNDFDLENQFTEQDDSVFAELVKNAKKKNLLAHEILSNTISNIQDVSDSKTQDTKEFNYVNIAIVISVSVFSIFAVIFLAVKIIRSISVPMGYMHRILGQIGQSGDLIIPDGIYNTLAEIAKGKDETAQCVSALFVLVNRIHIIDEALSRVASGDLAAHVSLQSERDTMGLAVEKMLKNLNSEFGVISSSTLKVHTKAQELAEGSSLLANGSMEQAESVSRLMDTVNEVNQKTEINTSLARNAAVLSDSIQESAKSGTEKMNQMIQAVEEIKEASLSIGKVIKVIDDIAFQTNILALNASVEAARAGSQGKGFAVVAEEVRNLATKSADAAKDTGVLITDTIEKAALGASIAKITSKSLEDIVSGILQNNEIISNMTEHSREQEIGIRRILTEVEHVETIVKQNDMIASQSAEASSEISNQSDLLKEVVSQFLLFDKGIHFKKPFSKEDYAV